jgi:peptidoglycan/LPS O-acetylase OafA/YrhL
MPRFRKASWMILALVAVLVIAGSVASAYNAYIAHAYTIGPARVGEVAAGRADVETALHGIRGTAAAFAAAYGALLLCVVLGPYRRGETWCWWAILIAAVVLFVFAAARQPFLGTTLGIGTPAIQLGLVLLALVLDGGRLKAA